MKHLILFLTCLFFYFAIDTIQILSQDHVSDAHKHIVKEAWKLLRSENPGFYNFIEMSTWINENGTNNEPWYRFDKGRVIAGAYREDYEELVYNYTCWTTASSTHFWKVFYPEAPNQFSPYHLLECTVVNCNVPGSAWNKLQIYKEGNWEFEITWKNQQGEPIAQPSFELWNGGTIQVTSLGGRFGFKFDKLVEGDKSLYRYGYAKITGAMTRWVIGSLMIHLLKFD